MHTHGTKLNKSKEKHFPLCKLFKLQIPPVNMSKIFEYGSLKEESKRWVTRSYPPWNLTQIWKADDDLIPTKY